MTRQHRLNTYHEMSSSAMATSEAMRKKLLRPLEVPHSLQPLALRPALHSRILALIHDRRRQRRLSPLVQVPSAPLGHAAVGLRELRGRLLARRVQLGGQDIDVAVGHPGLHVGDCVLGGVALVGGAVAGGDRDLQAALLEGGESLGEGRDHGGAGAGDLLHVEHHALIAGLLDLVSGALDGGQSSGRENPCTVPAAQGDVLGADEGRAAPAGTLGVLGDGLINVDQTCESTPGIGTGRPLGPRSPVPAVVPHDLLVRGQEDILGPHGGNSGGAGQLHGSPREGNWVLVVVTLEPL
mmetsp:Transcript_4436/g.9275  ORF Transcript_4436/g.9275 Transcript_4436/m.9275 type:complete len:296 (-) Transcript_4436:9-896(-)